MKKLLLVFAALCLAFGLKAQTPGCKILHKGTFQYYDNPLVDSTVTVIFKGKKKYEHSPKEKRTVISKIKWISECEFTTTIIEIKGNPGNFKIGSTLFVTVTDVTAENIVTFSATKSSITFNGKFKKIK